MGTLPPYKQEMGVPTKLSEQINPLKTRNGLANFDKTRQTTILDELAVGVWMGGIVNNATYKEKTRRKGSPSEAKFQRLSGG